MTWTEFTTTVKLLLKTRTTTLTITAIILRKNRRTVKNTSPMWTIILQVTTKQMAVGVTRLPRHILYTTILTTVVGDGAIHMVDGMVQIGAGVLVLATDGVIIGGILITHRDGVILITEATMDGAIRILTTEMFQETTPTEHFLHVR